MWQAFATVSRPTFPISLMLIADPILPQAQALFSPGAINGYLCLAGLLAAMLTLYGLIR